jgi:hypothetical protein
MRSQGIWPGNQKRSSVGSRALQRTAVRESRSNTTNLISLSAPEPTRQLRSIKSLKVCFCRGLDSGIKPGSLQTRDQSETISTWRKKWVERRKVRNHCRAQDSTTLKDRASRLTQSRERFKTLAQTLDDSMSQQSVVTWVQVSIGRTGTRGLT